MRRVARRPSADLVCLVLDCLCLPQIVTAMKTYPMDVELQCRSCLALRNLTFSASTIVESAGSKGAVAAVLAAMELHADSGDVVEQAVVALFNMIASHAENVDHLVAIPLHMDVLLGVLRNFVDSENVQATVMSVLEIVVKERPSAIPRLVGMDGVDNIVAAMRSGITKRSVMHQGAATLYAIISSQEHRIEAERKVKQAGGIDALLELLYISVTYKPPLRT